MFIVHHDKLRHKGHKTLFISLAIVLSFVVSIYLLLFTNKGFKFTLTSIRPILEMAHVHYDIEDIEGNILAFHLPNLSIQTDDVDIQIDEIDIVYDPFKIIFAELAVSKLNVNSVKVTLNNKNISKKDKDKKQDNPNKRIFPLTLKGQDANIHNVTVISNDSIIVDATNLNAKNVNIVKDTLEFKGVSSLLENETISLLTADGSLSFRPPFNINGKLVWELKNENVISSEITSHIKGSLKDTFTISTQGFVQTYIVNVGTLDFDLVTSINKDRLVNTINLLSFQQNTIQGLVALNYQDSDNLIYSVDVSGSYYPESMPDTIKYDLEFQANDQKISNTQSHNMAFQNCALTINKVSSHCQANLVYSNDALNLKTFTITNDTRNDNIVMYGDILPVPNLNWQLNIDQIGYYLSQFSAGITSTGSINDSWTQPKFSTHTLVNDIEYNQTEIPSILFDATYSEVAQNIEVTIYSNTFKFFSNLNGKWLADNNWQAQFTDARLTLNDSHWFIHGNPELVISDEKIDLTNFCLFSTASHACISTTLIPGDFMFKSDIDIYHQTLSQMFENYQTTSDLSTGIYFNTQNHVGNTLRYLFKLTPGEINLVSNTDQNAPQTDQNEKIPSNLKIHEAMSQGVLESGSLSSDTKLSFNNNSFINFQLKAINLNTDTKADDFINASLKSEINGLRFLSYVLKLPINIDGNIKADFELKGSADNSKLNGKGNISNLSLDLIPMGIKANNGNFEIIGSSPSKLNLEGNISIDKSKLNIASQFEYFIMKSDYTLSANIKANAIQVLDLPQIQMTVSPEINIKKDNGPITATGNVLINEANIYAEDFQTTANANKFSNDIVFINNRDQVIEQKKTLPIYANINVDLGQKTALYGFGFNSYLTGNLLIISYPGQITTGLGTIIFKEGVYQDYGKHFKITNNSNLNFNYSPVANPNLDITAMYHLPSDLMLANNAPSQIGIKIQGTAEDPKLTLFSVPSMSQANILSYIVVGQPLQMDHGEQYNNALQSAALAFALNGGSQSVLKDIQDSLGITDLSFGTMNAIPMMSSQLQYVNDQTNQSQTALFIGKSITSKFYVSYGISIFNGQQEIDTVYKFTDHWSLRTDYTTLDTGADIIYQITP